MDDQTLVGKHLRESRDRWKRVAFRQMIIIMILCVCLITIAISNLRHV